MFFDMEKIFKKGAIFMCTILRMENVGENKDIILFYGVNPFNEAPILRHKVRYMLEQGKNLRNPNTIVDTWDVIGCGSSYYYSHIKDTGEIVYKSAIFNE